MPRELEYASSDMVEALSPYWGTENTIWFRNQENGSGEMTDLIIRFTRHKNEKVTFRVDVSG